MVSFGIASQLRINDDARCRDIHEVYPSDCCTRVATVLLLKSGGVELGDVNDVTSTPININATSILRMDYNSVATLMV